MRSVKTSPVSPLSFSLLDLVMGLVGVILLISFGLAAQPSEKSNMRNFDRYIQISSYSNGSLLSDASLRFGLAFELSDRWIDPTDSSGDKVDYLSPGTGAVQQIAYLRESKLSERDVFVVYLALPAETATGLDFGKKELQLIITCGDGNKNPPIVRDHTLTGALPSKTYNVMETCKWS